MTRAIIEQIVDTSHVKIRIPEYNGAYMNADSTPTSELDTAVICQQPGITPLYKKGDVVFIDFERDNIEMPVVLGLIQGANSTYTSTDTETDSLNVRVNCTLPSATEIGDVSSNELQQLMGARNNIQRQIDLINEKINAIIIYNKNEGE